MNKTVIIIIAALFTLTVILGFCLYVAICDKKKLKAEIERLNEMFVFIEKEKKIHEESKKEADKKISDLHIGDSVHNALEELQKRRGSRSAG
jgi:hypothetical protein